MPGTTYWLAIQNDVDCNWFWSISDFNGGDAHQKLQNWVNYEVEEAFYLTGPGSEIVPEPSSVLLIGAGLVGLAIRRRMKALHSADKRWFSDISPNLLTKAVSRCIRGLLKILKRAIGERPYSYRVYRGAVGIPRGEST